MRRKVGRGELEGWRGGKGEEDSCRFKEVLDDF